MVTEKPKMPFGKHAGKFLSEVPEDYLQWLVGSLREKANNPNLFAQVEAELEARKPVPTDMSGLDAPAIFYGDAVPPVTMFILEQKGKQNDEHVLSSHSTLDDALGEVVRPGLPSADNDLILVWEVLPTGHRKVVWAFVGRNHEELYNQGTLPGHEHTLFQEAVDEAIPF